jgi:hypothetical protein
MEGRKDMGTDTLVQEFKGRKDHTDYIKRGIAVENYFVKEAKKRDYNIVIAPEEQNIKEHIDLMLQKKGKEFSVDVKAIRTGNKSRVPDDTWIVVEFLNTMGDKGWLYGSADYIVFERIKDFVFCSTKELVVLAHKLVNRNDRVSSYKDAEYKVWGRLYQGKKDLISRMEMSKILELKNTFIWKKTVDISN